MSQVRKMTKHRSPMQTGKPRFRHYPFTLGLEFLGLHWRLMIDSIFLALLYFTL